MGGSHRTKFPQDPIGDDGWTSWVQPQMEGFKLACCDCNLVHEMNFRLVTRQGKIRVQFQAKRDNRATANVRRHKRPPKW